MFKSEHSEALLYLRCIHSGRVINTFVLYTGINIGFMKQSYANKDWISLIQVLSYIAKLQKSNGFASDRTEKISILLFSV